MSLSSSSRQTQHSFVCSAAEEMNPSKRCTMEDAHVILQSHEWDCKSMSFMAVYDGHGGRDITDFLQMTFHQVVKQEMTHDDDASIETRLERSFLIADVMSKKAGLDTSGATVAVLLVQKHSDNNYLTLYAANVGDARIVYSGGNSNLNSTASSGKALRLTHDHLANDPSEVARIEESGGFVLRGRVLGVLAVARSLGDHGFKQFVIAKPYTSTTTAHAGEFVILACDGLWDVFQDQEAVDLVHSWIGTDIEVCDRQDVAAKLCKEAIVRGSTDNITVVVVWL